MLNSYSSVQLTAAELHLHYNGELAPVSMDKLYSAEYRVQYRQFPIDKTKQKRCQVHIIVNEQSQC